ncbi:TrmH family RNA methyltransferase [Geofilum rubicundum]|uniref:23S rRNA (Guanosine-2'-O-)-methyltransferase RlmB n=1 Tax=Geofilum rubicundum JCM 15548 TaxID=1236989 RepID=A0A0E9M2H9_9BACT|nr:TrmH family RNA methyltransferase [Geofilum rubicundum]GAO31803.1 23S rRNA (guanosine-2'-O-) -methyltransferase RlmB [Geofilum rubicundum JCM 15548]
MNPLNANRFFEQAAYPDTPKDGTPIIIADQLRNGENLGQIIRLAGNTGCQKVLIVTNNEAPRKSKMLRVADVAGKVMGWQYCQKSEVLNLIPDDYTLVALETSPASNNLFVTKLPKKMALIVGNESNGISEFLMNGSQMEIHIPVTGPVKSLNVAQATGLLLFEWVRQHVLSH